MNLDCATLGTVLSWSFSGTSCQATIMLSLWDKIPPRQALIRSALAGVQPREPSAQGVTR